MVMELLDKNLETIFAKESNEKYFSMMTIVLLVDQMVSRLKGSFICV